MLDDTIVAVATPQGQGGLAVVRLSGPAALSIARRLVAGQALAEPVASHRARLAVLRWPLDAAHPGADFADAVTPGQELDEALVLPILAPHSYTGEDTVEFFCHGGGAGPAGRGGLPGGRGAGRPGPASSPGAPS